MAANKHIGRICSVAAALSLLLAVFFMCGSMLCSAPSEKEMGYENRLFDTSRVHTLDIRMDDWGGFIETCESEEYALCSAVIDGEMYADIGIRAKGNTSLSSVSAMNSDRYSFKVEFDHYDSAKSYHGLDKLSLNNLIQDHSFLKDYLVYEMMRLAGAAAPLTSFVFITVNGEDRGLYLAVEGVEEAFLQRNYGNDYGELYKPDSLAMGGGRGNGRDFSMDAFPGESFAGGGEGFPAMPEAGSTFRGGNMPGQPEGAGGEGAPGTSFEENTTPSAGGGMGAMGAADVLLQYIGDAPENYANIFGSAKTEVTEADQDRLIEALQVLSSEDPTDALDIDALLRYFVVHNFVVNGDSYTGSMVHNYYLYEKDGRLSMIPWDYNLAFGTFHGNSASSAVNDPIDTPLSCGDGTPRPMIGWIFANEAYTELYHGYFAQFMEDVFDSGAFETLLDSAVSLIAPFVEKDPTKFSSYAEFESGTAAIRQFCLLRAESVRAQLAGSIPSTSEGQAEKDAVLVDTGELDLADMGTMHMGGGKGRNDTFGAVFHGGEGMPGMHEGAAAGSGIPPGRWNGESGGAAPFDEGMSGKDFPFAGSPPSGAEQQDASRFRGSGTETAGTQQGGASLLGKLGIPAVLLVFGLLFAALFKRRG